MITKLVILGDMSESDEMVGANIVRLRKARNIKQFQLADALGVSAPQMRRLEAGKRRIKADQIFTIANVLRCTAAELLDPISDPEITRPKTPTDDLQKVVSSMIMLPIKGEIQAGAYIEAREREPDEWEQLPLPRPDGHKDHFGLKVRGDSMNLHYPEDTILVCVPIHEFGYDLVQNEHVIVERVKGDMVEATVKEMRKDNLGRVWLWPKSTSPLHQDPIELPTNGEDHDTYIGCEEVRITAVVVADYRVRKRV